MTALDLLAQIAANPQSGYGLPPHWGWYIILYFFLGGLASGLYAIATLLDLIGDPRDRDAVDIGYLLAFPLVVVCGILLIVDLGKPLRFGHMLVQSENLPELMFKPWSPMSLGSWVLTAFGFFSFVSFVGALVERGVVRWAPLVRVDRWARQRPRPVTALWGVAGAFFGFFLGGYTGVLVTGTSIPFWHNARLMGALFLLSAASTSYALLMLLLMRRGRSHRDDTVERLARADQWTILLELLVLAAMLILLGSVAGPIVAGGYGVIFWLGVVGIGLLVPLLLHRVPWGRLSEHRRAVVGATCVLVGGLLLRFVVVMAPQWPEVRPWQL
jgi:formate-dependent nitrite reductase membrane component NrfD